MSEPTNPASEEPQAQPETSETAVTTESLLERLDNLHTDFARRNWWTKFANITTVLVGGIVLVLLVGYLSFGYFQIKDLTDSKMLYALLEQNLRNTRMPGSNRGVPTTLSQARSYLEKEIEKTSVRLAAQTSQQIIDRGPQVRQQLENFAILQAEQILDQGSQMTAQKFRAIIDNNRSLIEACIADLSTNDELAEERIAELVDAMEAEMKADLKGQADEILRSVRLTNERLEGLAKGEGLNSEHKLERQFLMILRRMQLERENPTLVGKEIAAK